MKDTVIKNNGRSRVIKAPSNMPSTYDEFRSKALEGKLYLDINVNADTTGDDAGIDVLGMAFSKANILTDNTATELGLSAESATPDSALKVLSAKSKRFATIVVGSSTSGYTANDVDYLCSGQSDQLKINSAIAALPSSGGNIVLLEGTYKPSAPITINKANINLVGVGNNTQITRNWSGASGSGLIVVSGDNCTIENMKINGLYSTLYNYTTNRGINVTGSSFTSKNMCVFDFYRGIYLSDSSNHTIVNTTSSNNGFYGMYIENCSENTIIGNRFNNNAYGIYLFRSNTNTIANNICLSNTYNGIDIHVASPNNNVAGNICEGNARGINLYCTNYDSVIGNACNNNEIGIQLIGTVNDATEHNTITGNLCCSNTNNGITLNSYAKSNTISGNTISNNISVGVAVINTASDNLVSSNVILNNETNISDSGTSTTIQGNKS